MVFQHNGFRAIGGTAALPPPYKHTRTARTKKTRDLLLPSYVAQANWRPAEDEQGRPGAPLRTTCIWLITCEIA